MHRPWLPLRCAVLPCWIAVRPICSALRSEIFPLHPRGVFKTNLSSLHRLSCARDSHLFNLYTYDGLKIGLVRACARARERAPGECAYAETIWFRSVWQRIREYFYFSRTLQLPPPSSFPSPSLVTFLPSHSKHLEFISYSALV